MGLATSRVITGMHSYGARLNLPERNLSLSDLMLSAIMNLRSGDNLSATDVLHELSFEPGLSGQARDLMGGSCGRIQGTLVHAGSNHLWVLR